MLLTRFRVKDKSMLPYFKEGDYVIARPYIFSKPKKGDAVIVKGDGLFLLKRIEKIENGKYFLVGNNRKESRDSRHFGPVSREEILGKVWVRVRQ